MPKNTIKVLLAATALTPLAAGIVFAQELIGSAGNNKNLILQMNNDGTGGEGLILQDDDANDGTYRDFARILNNGVQISGSITDIDDNTVDVGENLSVSGNISTSQDILVGGAIRDPNVGGTVQIADPLLVSGATDSETSLNVVGQTTLDATTIVGTTSITGATTVTGTTLINTSGSDDTSIGNANTNTTIVGTTSVTGTTSINTTGTATTTIGNSTTGTTVTMAGGSSNVSLANGTTSINTISGDANTNIGAAGNTTSIQSTSVVVGNNSASSNISVGTGSQSNTISVGTGSASNTIAMGNVQGGTEITAAAGNTAMAMQNDSITNTVTAADGVSGGTVIANNGSQRWIADDNGLLTQVTSTDSTSGTTAAMVVTNDRGNTHGLVVQETKTTLSGGTNSASMTLDDRGATFSNPANGRPIQVHGVADGTAPFDAVNVRQLYSGLATVLAAAPDIRLAPGKSGFGVSFGSYGGYEAFGIGLGHMYENGVVLSASVAQGEYSKTAAKASISWTW